MKRIIILVSLCLLFLVGCGEQIKQSQEDKLPIDLSVEDSNGDIVNLTLGGKLPEEVLPIIKDFYNNMDSYNDDVTLELGTPETLETFMKANYQKVIENGNNSDNEVVDKYIDGYYKNANVRVLGGNTENGYMAITVWNGSDKKIDIKDSIINSIWVLNSDNIKAIHRGVQTGSIFTGTDGGVFFGFDKVDDPQYSDDEYYKVEEDKKISVYVTDNKIVGFKISY